MNVFLKLCQSIIRRNKGFSICILIMSILSVSIGFLGANFGISSENTLNKFIEDCSMCDVMYLFDASENKTLDRIKDIDGVKDITKRFIYDTSIETTNGKIFSVRIHREDKNSLFKSIIHKQNDYSGDLAKINISKDFADYNNIVVGNHIYINTPNGKIETVVNAIVSNIETIKCVKDEMSSYESYQFAYIYALEDDFSKIIDVGDISNQLFVYFNDDLSINRQKQCQSEIREILSDSLISESLMKESKEFNTIKDDLQTLNVICKFIPGIIWFISLGFCFIFIKIIVDNQRKNIGLLRALGFSIKKIVMIFVLYSIIINVFALLFGTILGYKLLEFCLSIISSSYGIKDTVITVLPLITTLMSLVVFVIGIIATLLSSSTISKIDPSEAYEQIDVSSYEPPHFIAKLNLNSFIKISVVSMCRDYKRQIIGSLCICACIISMCVGLQGVKTIGHPIDAVYGDRFKYDLMIRNINQETIERINNEVNGIKISEPSIIFTADFLGEEVNVSTINESDLLTELKDSEANIIYPTNGIIIDEMCAKINDISINDEVKLDDCSFIVSGIAREILHNIIYINTNDAYKLGYKEANCLSIKLDDTTDIDLLEDKISQINENAYFVEFDLQKENIKDAFRAMQTVMLVFAILAFFIGSLLVINITVIDFNESKTKYAIMRALGTPIKRLAIVSLIQNTFRILVGIILAIPLSYLSNVTLLELLSNASQQYVLVDYNRCFIISCLIPLLYVVFGMLVSLYKINKLDFCQRLNEME